MKATDRGSLDLNTEECKGCGLCVAACPPKVLQLAPYLNPYGYHPVTYAGSGCTGCGICFFACPEPGAIAVFRATSNGSHRLHERPVEEEKCVSSSSKAI